MAHFKLQSVVEAPPTDIIGSHVQQQQGFGAVSGPGSGHRPRISLSGKAQPGSQLVSGTRPGGKAVR